jgi:hypothetical protein
MERAVTENLPYRCPLYWGVVVGSWFLVLAPARQKLFLCVQCILLPR